LFYIEEHKDRMRKTLKLISLFILFILASCVTQTATKINKSNLREIELRSHRQCIFITQNKNLKNTNELYWRCRVNILNEEIYKANITSDSSEYKKELEKIKNLLNGRVMQAKNAEFAKTQPNIDEAEHRICIIRYGTDKNFSDKYNDCRNLLLLSRIPVQPFGKTSHSFSKSRDVNNPENLKQIINNYGLRQNLDLTINEQAKITSQAALAFPTCGKYNAKSEAFKLCIKKQKKKQECEKNVPDKIKEKQLENLLFCEQQAIKNFPDGLAIYRTAKKDAATEKRWERRDKLSSLLGLKTTNIEDKEINITETHSITTGPKLSKDDIIKLREESNLNCLQQKKREMADYKKSLITECDKLGENLKEIKL
jgi:hypothetical protein